jgi:fatty-acid peroxygenase
MTVAVMNAAKKFLTDEMDYEVLGQDLEIQFDRLPALPRSGLIMARVRRRR